MEKAPGRKVTIIEDLGPIELSPDRRPWERQPGETSVAWAAFQAYRNLDPTERTLRRVFDIMNIDTSMGVSARSVSAYRAQWCWDERVGAYDAFVDDKIRKVLEKRIERSRIEVATLGRTFRQKAAEAIAELQTIVMQKVRQPDGTTKLVPRSALSPNQIVKLAEVGTKLERLALGFDDDTSGRGDTIIGQLNVQQNVIADEELIERAQRVIAARQGSAPDTDPA